MVQIVDLHTRKDLIDTVALWTWKEWGTENNLPFFKDLVQFSLYEDDIPQTYIALIDDKPIGTVSLIKNDLKSRQDLSPWLASLYIVEEYRNKGIGKQLQDFVIERARSLGYKELFSFTKHNGYYEKNQWEYEGEGNSYTGSTLRIYKRSLC